MQNKIKNMVEDGFAIKRISQILNISENLIKDTIKLNNLKLKIEVFDETLIGNIISLYKLGVSAKQLGIKYSIDKRRVMKWAKEHGVLRDKNNSHRFTEFNQHVFDNIDTYEKAYWLGFLYADAYNSDVTNTISLSLKIEDLDHLKKISDFIGLPHDKISYYKNKEGYEYYTCKMYSKYLCGRLIFLGCPRAKSFIIKYPDYLKQEFDSHFIRGLFDGDGSITYNPNTDGWKWSLVSTQECCEKIQEIILRELGFIINFHCISKTDHNTYELEVGGNKQINKLLDWIYNNSYNSIRMNRKYDRFIKLIDMQKDKVYGQFNKKMTEEEKRNILLEINNGVKVAEVCETYNRHPRTINQLRKTESLTSKSAEIIKINGNCLTAKYIKSLSLSEKEELVKPIFNYFRNQGWIYPEESAAYLKEEFDKLVSFSPNISNVDLFNNSSLATKICKHFCHTFFHSTEKNKKTMIDIWNNDDDLLRLIRNRLVLTWKSKSDETFSISHRMLIQGMRSMRLVPSITIFKPTIAKYICEKYSNPGDIVGDYSCGFGGRLLGAMSSGRKYIGTDPLTTPELQEMIKFYGFKDCTVIQSGSEDYCGDKNSVDLYWSSPPYFDQEVYSKDMTQSYNRGKDYFYNVYWKKTLENVKFMLKPGKWFGTNIKNQLMLDIAKEYFGEPEEIINLKTVRSHLTKGAGTIKYEYVYLFKNE